MAVVVKKFGGTSVANPKLIKEVAKRIVESRKKTGSKIVAVISAMGDTTDRLIDLSKQISQNASPRELDVLLASGEQVSSSLLAMAIKDLGHDAISLNGEQAGILTEASHTKARIVKINPEKIGRHLEDGRIVVVAGFQGITKTKEITTLGRGGSDTTAVALASSLNSKVCELYKDVDGIFTADPNIVSTAKKLDEISYEEMLELTNLGAQVLHSRAVDFAKRHDVIIHVRSSFNTRLGTLVKSIEQLKNRRDISGVTVDFNQAKLGILAVPDAPNNIVKIFNALAAAKINVDTIVQVPRDHYSNDIAFTVPNNDAEKAYAITNNIAQLVNGQKVIYDNDIAKVSIVGIGMAERSGIASDVFETIVKHNINIQMISTSDIKISCIVKRHHAKLAATVIHNKFLS